MSNKILLYTQNNELSNQIKGYLDADYKFAQTDNLDKLHEYLKSEETWLLVYDFLSEFDENRKIIGDLLATYPFQLIILVVDRATGKDCLQVI